jgi:hypothetical protein
MLPVAIGCMVAMPIALAQTEILGTPFSDIAGHPNEEAIEYLQMNGIVKGYLDGTFKPDNQINRAEFVKIIVGAYLEIVKEGAATHWENDYCDNEDMILGFKDTDDKAWYAFRFVQRRVIFSFKVMAIGHSVLLRILILWKQQK